MEFFFANKQPTKGMHAAASMADKLTRVARRAAVLALAWLMVMAASDVHAQLTPNGFELPSPLTGNEIVDCQVPSSPYITTCTTEQIAALAAAAAPQVNVTDYGAIAGTCSNAAAITANNTAIQAALNSRKNVNFPAGNYPHKSQGFNITTANQKVHGPTCTGTGTASPSCPASIQDCSPAADWLFSCSGTPADTCGYLSVYVTDVEIHDLSIIGNNPLGSGVNSVTHKGVFARGSNINNLYVHDMYITNTNAESIYSDATGTGTRFVRNTVAHGQYSGLNFNSYGIFNASVTDNYITDQGGCILVAANDAYVLRNICQGGAHITGADAITIAVPGFYVVAYNTINQWNSSCCAVGVFHLGFPFGVVTGPGVVAFNTLVDNLSTGVAGVGATFEIEDVTGPAVVAFNAIRNNGNSGQTVPGMLVHGTRTDAVLISNNDLDGNALVEPIGIEIYSNVPMVNRVQVNNSNTFGTIPTPISFLTAPAGVASIASVFGPYITRALAYAPDGLLNTAVYDSNTVVQFGTTNPSHVASGQPAIPAINSCSTGAVAAGSTDTIGKVTATGATTCSITWSVAYKTAPFCLVQDNTVNGRAIVGTPSTTGLSVAGLTANDVFTYVCVAPSGG